MPSNHGYLMQTNVSPTMSQQVLVFPRKKSPYTIQYAICAKWKEYFSVALATYLTLGYWLRFISLLSSLVPPSTNTMVTN